MLRLLSGLLIATCVASAASFPVTVFTDTAATAGGAAAGSGTGAGSPGDLRSQIIAANAFGGAANTITFTCNTPPCTITLNGPLPAITSNLTIDGGTVGNVIIDGNSAYRVFFVDTGTVLLANLQIQNAAAIGGAGGLGVSGAGGGAGFGAGLFINQATASVSLQTVVFRNVAAIGGSGGSGFDDGNLPGFGGAGGGGMGFGGAAGDIGGNSRGGGGGGGIQGTGSAFNGSIGGNGGAGGGGAGASNGAVGSGSGGSAYAGNTAGADGGSHMAGNGGFGGGGGGGDCTGTAGAGGFGGGGGGIGSCFELPGGAGGFGGGGGGGGNLNGGTSATVGGVAGGTGGNGNNTGDGGGGGGGAAAGPAIFVASGSLTILNSTATGTITAAGGAGGAAPGGGTTVGGNGGSNNTPVFNYGGTVNGSNTTGPIAGALGAGLPATHFSVTAPSPVTSYTTNAFIVTALDATEATATGYNGTVHLTSTDPIFANGTGDQVLTAGTAQFNLAMKTAGTQTVTATDTILSNITGISNNITVVAGPATRFFISSTPVSSQAGTAFGFTVTALDLANNTVTNYGGTVHFTSTDGAAVLPPNSILVNGVGSFNATLNTAGSQTITATDALNPITGSSGSINVLLAAPTISMGFSPTTVQVGGTSSTQLSFSMSNSNSTAITGISFSNTFPAGLVLDSLVAYTCGGAGATLNGTGWSISGVTLAANTSCGGSIRMHATSLGTITDTSGTVTSTNAPASGTAMATLTVNPDVPTLAEAFGAGSITQGNTTSLTFTLVNPNTTTAVSSVNFIDTLPAGLVVATPSGLTTSCGGAATAVSGTTAISLSNVTIAASASCTFTVNVLANATGRFTNTTGAIGSNEGTGLPASATLSVSAAPLTAQTITFAPLPVHTYGDGPVTFTATASSGLPVTFFVWSGPCASINGSFTTVRLTGAGTCVVAANEAGGSGYDAASTVFRNLTINPAPLTVTANNAAMAAGGPLPAFSASFAGFVNGDTSAVVGGSAAFATEATVKSPPGTYPISVSAGTMMAANYTFRFVPGTLTVMGTAVTGLANSASLTAGAIAPNALLTLFNPPASCVNASMSIDGSTAQVLYAGPTQINFMTAGMVANETAATLQVLCGGQIAETVQAPVAAVNPGIFTQTGTGAGQASVVNQDGTINGAATPAQRGTYIALYGTGFGSYNPVGADGLQHTANTVTATVGGVPTSVAYAGYAPTEVTGLQQINIQVPASAAPGASVPVVLTVNGISTTTGVTIAVQ